VCREKPPIIHGADILHWKSAEKRTGYYFTGRMQRKGATIHGTDIIALEVCRGPPLVVRVLGYRSGGPGSIPGTTKKRSGSGTGSTQPREYKLRSYLIEE
jgi:hypothetical protein